MVAMHPEHSLAECSFDVWFHSVFNMAEVWDVKHL
jgi:hypothetical protein